MTCSHELIIAYLFLAIATSLLPTVKRRTRDREVTGSSLTHCAVEYGPGGHFQRERMGTPFPLLKSLRTHHGRHCESFSGPKCSAQNAPDCWILHMQSQNCPGSNTPGPSHKRPRAWTQTPISALLASVPIVPVLPNDPRSSASSSLTRASVTKQYNFVL